MLKLGKHNFGFLQAFRLFLFFINVVKIFLLVLVNDFKKLFLFYQLLKYICYLKKS